MFRIYIILIIVAFFGSAFYYYKDTQARLQQAAENLAKAETAAKANELAVKEMIKHAENLQVAMDGLNAQLKEAEAYQDRLAQKLRKHNLTLLAMKKPELIEKRVNNASKKLLEEFEAITAVPASQ